MGGGGSGNTDYHSEVQQGLAQANQPKSQLSVQLSNLFGNILAGQGQGSGMTPPSAGQIGQGQMGLPSGPNDTRPSNPLPNPNNNIPDPNNPGMTRFMGGNVNMISPTNIDVSPTDIGVGSLFSPGNYSPLKPGDMNAFSATVPGSLYPPNPANFPGNNGNQNGGYTVGSGTFGSSNPFTNLGSMTQMSTPISTGNAGFNDPRLTQNNLPNPNQISPVTGGSDTFFANPQQNIQLGGDPNQFARLGQQFNSPNIDYQNFSQGMQQGLQNYQPQQANLGNVNGIDPSILNGLGMSINNPGNNNIPGLQGALQNSLNSSQNTQGVARDQLLGQVGQRANLGNVNTNIQAQNVSPGSFQSQQANLNGINQPHSVIQDSAFSNAMQQILNQRHSEDVANLRARFGASGGASRGTPAQYAEAQLDAQQLPQIAAALGQIRQQESGLDLQKFGIDSNNQLQNAANTNSANLQGRGQDIQAGIANQSAGLQAGQTSGSLGLQARGQDLQNFSDSRGQDVGLFNAAIQNSLGLGGLNNQNLSTLLGAQNTISGMNTQAGIDTNAQNLQRLLGAGGLGIQQGQNSLQARGQDLNNFQGAQSNYLQAQGLGVQNANNANQQSLGYNALNSSNQLGAQGLNLQGANSYQNLLSQFQGLGLQQNNQNQQNNQFNANLGTQTGLANRGLTLQDLQQQMSYGLGANSQNSQNAQFNASQSNQLNQNFSQQLQAAQEAMFGRNANATNQLAAYIAQLAAMGIPGGSANINVSPIQPQQGGGFGGTLAGLGALATGIGAVKGAF